MVVMPFVKGVPMLAQTMDQTSSSGRPVAKAQEALVERLKKYFRWRQEIRRGICLLHAGQFAQAEEVFSRAAEEGCLDRSLPSLLASCLVGQDRAHEAAELLSRASGEFATSPHAIIQRALALWSAERSDEAVRVLRDAVSRNTECAELHYQLGNLLAAGERYEEAELRFTQAVNIDRNHADALVSLGLCCGLRGAMAEALVFLQLAQALRPFDARIGVLLARAARSSQETGRFVRVQAAMPDDSVESDAEGIAELSRILATEPDFVDALLSIPQDSVDCQVFTVLLATLESALEKEPEQAELHHHCGRVLDRLGRPAEAIDANERAVAMNPKFTRALIELGKLYARTDRAADATIRLEQAVAAGADYADVHFLLGNLYRDQGNAGAARRSYHRALTINSRYAAARQALELLPA